MTIPQVNESDFLRVAYLSYLYDGYDENEAMKMAIDDYEKFESEK